MDKYCQLAQIGYQKFEKVVDILGGKWKLRILYFLGHLSMIFDAKWQNFCVRKIPMPMLV